MRLSFLKGVALAAILGTGISQGWASSGSFSYSAPAVVSSVTATGFTHSSLTTLSSGSTPSSVSGDVTVSVTSNGTPSATVADCTLSGSVAGTLTLEGSGPVSGTYSGSAAVEISVPVGITSIPYSTRAGVYSGSGCSASGSAS